MVKDQNGTDGVMEERRQIGCCAGVMTGRDFGDETRYGSRVGINGRYSWGGETARGSGGGRQERGGQGEAERDARRVAPGDEDCHARRRRGITKLTRGRA